jgi:hypothetical protein
VDADPDTHPGQESDAERLRQVSGTWTPAPEGYTYNLGAQFVPMPIRGPDGRIWPAQFTKVEFTDNPTVHGFRAGSPTHTPITSTPPLSLTSVSAPGML